MQVYEYPEEETISKVPVPYQQSEVIHKGIQINRESEKRMKTTNWSSKL